MQSNKIPKQGNNRGIKRGQVWWLEPEIKKTGHIQGGPRPVIIVSNNVCNFYSSVVHVCPCTTSTKKAYPIQVPFIMKGRINLALTDQITTVNIYELVEMIGMLGDDVIDRMDQAIKWQLGLDPLPDTRSNNSEVPKQLPRNPVGSQVDKFNKKWFTKPAELPKVVAASRKKRNVWDEKTVREYVADYKTMTLEEICSKYNVAKVTAIKYYASFMSDRPLVGPKPNQEVQLCH